MTFIRPRARPTMTYYGIDLREGKQLPAPFPRTVTTVHQLHPPSTSTSTSTRPATMGRARLNGGR